MIGLVLAVANGSPEKLLFQDMPKKSLILI